jgi:hypothetical protein
MSVPKASQKLVRLTDEDLGVGYLVEGIIDHKDVVHTRTIQRLYAR